MKKIILFIFLIPLIAKAQFDTQPLISTFEDGASYTDRMLDSSATMRGDNLMKSCYLFLHENGLADSTKLLFLPEAGIKTRTSGDNWFITDAIELSDFDNDLEQTSADGQPYLSGNIAPNERLAAKNVTGESRLFTHPGITVSGTHTIIQVLNDEDSGKVNITFEEVTSGTLDTISFTGSLYFYSIYAGTLTATQESVYSAFIRTVFPEIPSVQIGTQTWATSNFEVVATPMGNVIPEVTGATEWARSQTIYDSVYAIASNEQDALEAAAMWCYYNNDPDNGAIYGKLYNWFAVKLLQNDIDAYNAANPDNTWGWHVPTQAEFTTLQTYLGGSSVAGGKMKVPGTDYWNSPNTGADNSSGFSAICGGWRSDNGAFAGFNDRIFYSSADSNGGGSRLQSAESAFYVEIIDKRRARSLRLLKD